MNREYGSGVLLLDPDAKETRKSMQNFTRLVNQHMKTVAREAGITGEITTYRERHTFITTIMRKALPSKWLPDCLGTRAWWPRRATGMI